MQSKLFKPMAIGKMELKNRTFMAPMSLGYESEDGTVNETLQDYWEARAKGGVGCIILDALSVDPQVPYLGNTLCFRSEESIISYKAFTDKIHGYGTKIIPQITHPGPESVSAFYGIAAMASSVYLNSMGQKTRSITVEEIAAITGQYAEASYQAKQAGFDGIELHCAHAYMLLGSFLSPMRNKRTDAYGGSLKNRARFLFEVIDAIKAKCGEDFPIILRISGSERSDQGNTLEDMKNLVPELTAHGIDAFEISGGTQYEQCNKIIPCHGEHQGLNVKEAKAIKKIASVPVIVVGKITDPDYAMQLVDNGLIDGVVLGRALLSDPDFVHKAEAGAFDSIAPCAACGIGCVGEQTKRRPASCVINPALGREKELVLRKTEKPKKAVVVGGGIGGMAAARALGLCGHQVTLFEQSDRLGGQMNVACIPPHKQEVSRWIIYLKKELEACGVSVHLNTEATAETLKAMAPELLIIASGAKEIVPPIKGVEKETAITAQMVLKNDTVIAGGNILVVGGGMVGCEVAETLIHQKRGPMAVTIIEMADEIGEGMVPNNKEPMLRRLKSLGVGLETGTKLEAVEGTDVTVNQRGEVKTLKGFTHIIYACGSKAENNLYTALEKTFPKVVCIGDANGPRQALEAVREGFEAAMTL